MKYVVFLFLLICFARPVSAQIKLSGKVNDKTKSAGLNSVTLKLLNLKDSTQTSNKSNDLGEFNFDKVAAGTYRLSTSLLGYKPYVMEIQISNKPLTFQIDLEPGEVMIEEIAITAPPAVLVKGDTMEFNSRNFKTREYADADEMVAQVPGVMIDEDGNVQAHGEPVTRILVDGKEFFSTDPKVALKNLPADMIDKLQIIDEKSEAARFSGFDDGKRNKVINIVTKPDKKRGHFGRMNAGKGDSDKFALSSVLNAFKGDRKLGLNLMANNINETNFGEQGRGGSRRGNSNTERGLSDTYAGAASYSNTILNKKMEVSADYNFNNSKTLSSSASEIEYISGNRANQFQSSTNLGNQNNSEHKFGGRVKWDIDSVNKLDFTPNLNYTIANRDNISFSKMTREQTEPMNNSDRTNLNDNSNLSFGGGLNFNHRFKNPGQTISFNINGNKSTNDALGQSLAFNEYYKNSILDRIDTNNRENVTYGYGTGFNSRLSFSQNISKLSRLQASYGFRNTSNYSDRKTLDFLAETGQYEELNERLSNEFRNDFNHHSAGLSYSYNKHDTLRIQFGLNYEHGLRINDRTFPYDLKTTADFSSFLPDFTTQYYFTKERSIEFNYNTATNTPSIDQLQDYLNNGNPLYMSNGNPNLNQEYSHRMRLQFRDVNKTTGRSLNTNVNFNYVNNKIINSVFTTDTAVLLFDDVILGAGGQYVVPLNIDGVFNINLNNSYGLPLKKLGINLNLSTDGYYNRNFSYLNDDLIKNLTFGFAQRVGVFSTFSNKIIIGANYNYNVGFTRNPTSGDQLYNVQNHRLSHNFTLEFLSNMVLNYNLAYIQNGGIMGRESTSLTLLNASIGYKLFKKKNGELALKAFDIFNNATNINRSVNDTQIANITSNTLNRYFLLSLTYNIRKFGGGQGGRPDRGSGGPWQGGGRPGGGFGRPD
ncbi:outer membrane beta-barrel protein [Sphingobacterium sp. HJSM2_6]|uniref:outer membrane beta-barrel protein n=1 Tax=Sphingobacterium sp. HJSM2_6 TaxID=3366264 RepID=UPI003BD84749